MIQKLAAGGVVAEYDQDGWHITKYVNGYAKCYKETEGTFAVNAWSVWSGTSIWYASVPPIAYPITFTEVPEETCMMMSGNFWGNYEGNTMSQSSRCSANRPSKPNTAIRYRIQYSVCGKYK